MFRRNFQSAANMPANQFASILFCSFINILIITSMKQQIVTDTASDKTLLYAGQ